MSGCFRTGATHDLRGLTEEQMKVNKERNKNKKGETNNRGREERRIEIWGKEGIKFGLCT